MNRFLEFWIKIYCEEEPNYFSECYTWSEVLDELEEWWESLLSSFSIKDINKLLSEYDLKARDISYAIKNLREDFEEMEQNEEISEEEIREKVEEIKKIKSLLSEIEEGIDDIYEDSDEDFFDDEEEYDYEDYDDYDDY